MVNNVRILMAKVCQQVQIVDLVLVIPVQNGESVLKDLEDQKAANELKTSEDDVFFALAE